MSKLTETILIAREDLDFIKELLSMTGDKIYDKYGLYRDETITRTAKFSDGTEADIKLVICEGSSTPYTEGVLYNDLGGEIMCTDPEAEYDGTWSFEDDDTEYEVIVKVVDAK